VIDLADMLGGMSVLEAPETASRLLVHDRGRFSQYYPRSPERAATVTGAVAVGQAW